MLETGYSGTRATHLMRGNLQLNHKPVVDRGGRLFVQIAGDQPNQNYNRFRWRINDGESSYHAFRMVLTKRFSRGFQLQSSYTFSKSTDDGSAFLGSGDFSADRQPLGTGKENALAAFHVQNSFYTNFVVDIPSGDLTGAASKILGGWTLSSILRFNSGYPFFLNQDFPRDGRNRTRYVSGPSLNLVSGADQGEIFPQNPDRYYNSDNYLPLVTDFNGTSSSGFFVGNIGKAHIISPGIANMDITLIKETPLWGEDVNLQFRAEFFNLFNRPNFDTPGSRVFNRRGSPQSGRGEITSTITSAREIQFALKLVF
ncbi:MAG: hypothetical protein IH846_10225 [Acidobacteria bacterium]|nr:hypothetical protein [Acidobacteriota bacterium]